MNVFVFVPFANVDGHLVSPYYDTPEFRDDVGQWMAAAGCAWEWVPVTHANLAEVVARVEAHARTRDTVVLNICDGDDLNGYPGLSVVHALEAAGIPFTGADSRFYAVSTSKLEMKRRFAAAGVPTAPWVVIEDPARDVPRAAAKLGLPYFMKPDVSFGSAGLTVASRVTDVAGGIAVAQRLFGGLHGCWFEPGEIFAEAWLGGREFTVLLVEDPQAPGGLWVLPPAERVFDPHLPAEERFLTYERICGEYEVDAPLMPGTDYYHYELAPAAISAGLADLAASAFRAVDGVGYARVDIRCDATTARPFVLEVNANCALSSDDTSSVGCILQLSRVAPAAFVGALLARARGREAVRVE